MTGQGLSCQLIHSHGLQSSVENSDEQYGGGGGGKPGADPGGRAGRPPPPQYPRPLGGGGLYKEGGGERCANAPCCPILLWSTDPPPPPRGSGTPIFMKSEKKGHVSRKRRILLLNSYPLPHPLSEILDPPLISSYKTLIYHF